MFCIWLISGHFPDFFNIGSFPQFLSYILLAVSNTGRICGQLAYICSVRFTDVESNIRQGPICVAFFRHLYLHIHLRVRDGKGYHLAVVADGHPIPLHRLIPIGAVPAGCFINVIVQRRFCFLYNISSIAKVGKAGNAIRPSRFLCYCRWCFPGFYCSFVCRRLIDGKFRPGQRFGRILPVHFLNLNRALIRRVLKSDRYIPPCAIAVGIKVYLPFFILGQDMVFACRNLFNLIMSLLFQITVWLSHQRKICKHSIAIFVRLLRSANLLPGKPVTDHKLSAFHWHCPVFRIHFMDGDAAKQFIVSDTVSHDLALAVIQAMPVTFIPFAIFLVYKVYRYGPCMIIHILWRPVGL